MAIFSDIDTPNTKFVFKNGVNWIIEEILTNYPDITITSSDFLFDWQGCIDYVFTQSITSYFSEIYYSKGESITSVETKEK